MRNRTIIVTTTTVATKKMDKSKARNRLTLKDLLLKLFKK